MSRIEVDIYMDYVVLLNKYRIDRPARIARSLWMALWRRML